ncbi:MAG TPA: prolyl oligopeptidase family serine peptidase, partial [Acidobacteriota bacterium]|nr:prolyl oligopeptidase family serine peptidase [Acidobacteriota bacterium]
FLHVNNVKTPTLILCGELDVNVSTLNSEQTYQALRRLGVETMLVIYPGQYHNIVKPSYVQDQYERYLAWLNHYVMGAGERVPAKKAAEIKTEKTK